MAAMPTLAAKLGTTTHLSPLLRKAQRRGAMTGLIGEGVKTVVQWLCP